MLRQATCVCRAVLGPCASWEDAAGAIALQYAACSLVKAVTAGQPGLAFAHSPRRGLSAVAAQQQQDGITIDESAVRKLKELRQESPGKDVLLRIEVEGGGCSGFQYKFRLDEGKAQDDLVFERDGVQVVCDSVSLDFLKGAVVEYEDSLMRSAFQIASNPNSESTCGCGTSFVAKI